MDWLLAVPPPLRDSSPVPYDESKAMKSVNARDILLKSFMINKKMSYK